MGRRGSRPTGGAAVAASLAAILLAACGGSSGPTKAEYTKQAAAICRDANDSVTKVRADATTTSALAASIGQVVSIEQGAARRVRALRAPKGDEAVLRQWLGLVDETLAELDAAAHAAATGDGAAAGAANQRAKALDQQADAIADRYGLDACAATG
ncbi:MAG TPA: hypothetical protein VIB48_16280 [Acidimicrobiia bacterium]|jgi:hypothetical protein